jgi:ankyrin repeat protein
MLRNNNKGRAMGLAEKRKIKELTETVLPEREKELQVLCRAALRGETEQVASALMSGIDVNAQDAEGMSPLHWAVWGGQEDTVRLLLARGANPNMPSNEGEHATPYWHAAKDFGMPEIAELLREAGGTLCGANK